MSEQPQPVRGVYQPGLRRAGRMSVLLLACCLLGLLAACAPAATPTGAASKASTVTPNAQATADAEPVLIQLRATPTGTIAAASLEITVETTVTNQTGRPISIAHHLEVTCLPLPLVFSLLDGAKQNVWQETHNYSCPLGPVYDVLSLPAGGSKQWTTTLDLRDDLASGLTTLSPGTYTLAATGLLWHEGAISESGETHSASGYADGQTMDTLQ